MKSLLFRVNTLEWMFPKLVETDVINGFTYYDRPHRLFVGLGEGVAPTALRAFHQLIVKRTAVAEVRDRGKSDGAETKTFTCNFLYSSHPRFNKPLDLCFHFK